MFDHRRCDVLVMFMIERTVIRYEHSALVNRWTTYSIRVKHRSSLIPRLASNRRANRFASQFPL